MKLFVSSPYGTIYDGEINYIVCKGQDGEYAIMKDHIPSVSIITSGHIKIVASKTEFVSVINAIVEFKDNIASVLTQEAALGSSLDAANGELDVMRKARESENKRKNVDMTVAENELKKNIKKSGAGKL